MSALFNFMHAVVLLISLVSFHAFAYISIITVKLSRNSLEFIIQFSNETQANLSKLYSIAVQ